MINILDRGLESRETMSHYTLRWITRVWRNNVSDQTIRNCFVKSTVIGRNNQLQGSMHPENLHLGVLYDQVIDRLGEDEAQEVIPLDDFLDPSDENHAIEPDQSDIILDLSQDGEDVAEDDLDDEYIFGPPPELPSDASIIRSVHDVLLWFQHKGKGTPKHDRQIEKLTSDLTRLQVDERKQKTLDEMGFLKRE
jgi:hypothetical protein